MRFISLFFLLTLISRADVVDIYLTWKYSGSAKFNIYRKLDKDWEKIGETNSNSFTIVNSQIKDQVFKITATTTQGESSGSQTIYLVSNKIPSPGGIKLLTGSQNGIILESPTQVKLYGVVKP